MRLRRTAWRNGLIGVGLLLTLAGVAVGVARTSGISWAWRAPRPREKVVTATVRRADLHGSLTASGRVQSTHNTNIDCELELLDAPGHGSGMAGGASTILDVVDEGAVVKKGDVLCRLDASDYEEMVRQQQITVEQAKAEFRQAELNLQVARMAVAEFRDGNMVQDLQQMDGLIALAESEQERIQDRLGWSRRMLEKGYVAKGQVANDELALTRASIALTQSRLGRQVYQRFTAPRTIRTLESQVSMTESIQTYQTMRLQRNEERLAHLKRQVECCTIVAPHDGLVVYANVDSRNVRIEAGAMVRQKQHLFYLPDLAHMEVETLLHETVVEQVKPGMRARVRVEGLPDRVLEGRVTAVDPMVIHDRRSDVPYFRGIVRLDTAPRGLRPGMTGEVEVLTESRTDVLTIPPGALAVEEGRQVCYVASAAGLERRSVALGQATTDLLEVTRGLEEGEEVVLDPEKTEPDAVEAAAF